jgi:hypothetical protein
VPVRSRVQISDKESAIATEDFRGFSQLLQANAGMVPYNLSTTASFQILSNSSFLNHTFIRRYIILVVTENTSLLKPQTIIGQLVAAVQRHSLTPLT